MRKTESWTEKSRAETINRYEGALLGVAVGDALGAPLEFMTAEQIRQKHAGEVTEMIGGGWLSVEPGEVTDDTQMTLAVAEGIAEGGSNEDKYSFIGENFLRWYATSPKDIGNTCASVIRKAVDLDLVWQSEWEAAAEQLWKQTNGGTAGNGALMRTVYPAIYYKNTFTAQEVAVNIGRMTHYHPDSDSTVSEYVRAIHIIANSPEMTIEQAKQTATAGRSEVERVKQKMKGTTAAEPTGWAVDSLLCAYDAIDKTDSFEDALIYATNLGGDADTIGAITGGLAGAIYGAEAIPSRWVDALNNEPNAKTVRLFEEGYKDTAPESLPEGYQPNILALRLAELAMIAYKRSHEKG